MPAVTVPAPGTKYGPCDSPCEHRDCATMRQTAATPCCICDEPIGYDTPYFKDRNPDGGWFYTSEECQLEAQEAIARARKILGARL